MQQSPDRIPRAHLIAVAGVAFAASIAGLANRFANDDLHLILENVRLHRLSGWWQIVSSPYWPPPYSQDLFRPLTSLLLAIQYALGHGDPMLFRVASYTMYAAAAVGVLLLAGRLLPRRVALGTALLFAAHPVHVEPVALAVGQSELLVGLAALAMVMHYLDRRRQEAGALSGRDWGILGALYLAASFSKEHGLILPGLLLATECGLLPRPAWSRVRRLGPGYAFLAVLGLGVMLIRSRVLGGSAVGSFTAEALQGVPLGGRALTFLQIVPEWGRLLLWPAHLRADYSPQEFIASIALGGKELLGLVLLILAGFAAFRLRRSAAVLGFGLLWWAVAVIPVSNVLLPTGILLAERTLFLPSIGVLLALGALAALPETSPVGWLRRDPRLLSSMLGALILLGMVRSAERQRVWRDEAFLSVRTVQDAPRSFRAQRAYADVLFDLGQPALAEEAYRRAVALAPMGNAWRVRNDWARRYRALGETAKEIDQLQASIAEFPEQDDVRGYLVAGYLLGGQYGEAAEAADSALARGGAPGVFARIRALADSAARAAAPPGSIRIRMVAEPAGR